MSSPLTCTELPRPAPARVLACGAFLKNRACLLDGQRVLWSAPHGDLSDPAAVAALAQSIGHLWQAASGPVQALAHDLHPDFASTRLAQQWAADHGLPALAVQHHQAHVAVVMAEQGWRGPVLGLALDGVGLGSDGSVWGGELLQVELPHSRRLDHLPALCLPGGDVAAREPWRMAAAALHAAGLTEAIVPRFAPVVGPSAARLLVQMVQRQLHCPVSTSAGRWFDAAAGLLGLCHRQSHEAQAAIALEQLARQAWPLSPDQPLDQALRPAASLIDLVPELLAAGAGHHPGDAPSPTQAQAAARFHLTLADSLARAAAAQAQLTRPCITQVVLSGGCFFNTLLTAALRQRLQDHGLQPVQPQALCCGDASLALGQAWVVAHALCAQDTAAGASPSSCDPAAGLAPDGRGILYFPCH